MTRRQAGETTDVVVDLPPRLLRRSLLLGAAAAGVWLVASTGHAHAEAATPAHPIAGQVQQLVTTELPQRPAPSTSPTLKSVTKQAGTRLDTVLRKAVPAAVGGLVKTVTSPTGTLIGHPVVPLPIATPVPVPVLAPAVPTHSVASVARSSATAPPSAVRTASSASQASAVRTGWTPMASRQAVPAVHSQQLTGVTSRIAPVTPTRPTGNVPVVPDQGGCGDGASVLMSGPGPQSDRSLVCGEAPPISRLCRWSGAEHDSLYPPRQRATAPAVSPD